MSKKEWAGFGFGAAVTLRLTKPWHFSGRRHILGDSAFGSVSTGSVVDQTGNDFTGAVKTATKFYPMTYLQSLSFAERGDIGVATCDVNGTPMIAAVWNDKKPKYFISTCGTTGDGEPSQKKRRRQLDDGTTQTYHRPVKRARLVADYHTGAQKIDVHNHYRQGGLRLEDAWKTDRYAGRVQASLVGTCEVDALLARQLETGRKVDHPTFTADLADELLEAAEKMRAARQGVPTLGRGRTLRSRVGPSTGPSGSAPSLPRLLQTNTLPWVGKRSLKSPCIVCRAEGRTLVRSRTRKSGVVLGPTAIRSTAFCSACSTVGATQKGSNLSGVCMPSAAANQVSSSQCWSAHLMEHFQGT
jgi:hypothetical protein